jgi:hypothetical protein
MKKQAEPLSQLRTGSRRLSLVKSLAARLMRLWTRSSSVSRRLTSVLRTVAPTIANRETGETYPDNRQQPQDLVQAVNVMTGRAAMHINDSPHPHLDRPFVGVLGREPTPDPMADPSQEGEEVVILRNYQPHGDPLPPRLTAGTVTKLPLSEAKKLIKRGVVQFVDEDRE